MEKVAAWRPVRRGKDDRALTRYKSHYGVNLLDPSPPTDFQPPGTVLGCRLWATSHANSDKVPLSPSVCLFLSCLYSRSLCRPPSLLLCLSFSCCLQCRPRRFPSFLSSPCLSLPLCPSSFIRQAVPTRGIPGAPQPPRARAREYLSPGHLRAD